jgi:hypothetical protein
MSRAAEPVQTFLDEFESASRYDVDVPGLEWVVDRAWWHGECELPIVEAVGQSGKKVHRPLPWRRVPACPQRDRGGGKTKWQLKDGAKLGPAWRDECNWDQCDGYAGWDDE